MDTEELKKFIVAVIEEEFCPNPVDMAKRWAGGAMVLNPSNDSQAKEIPIEVLFRKIVGIRDALRVLEQKLNTHDGLAAEDKLTLQGYITKAYGSLTTFNVLFKEEKDKFVGTGGKGGDKEDDEPKLTMGQARRRLGLNEYGKD